MFALLIAKVLPAIAAYAMNLFHYTCNHVARVRLRGSVTL